MHESGLHGPEGAEASIYHHPRLITRGMLTLRTAAVAGVGVVQLPRMMIDEQLASGELVQVLPEWGVRTEQAGGRMLGIIALRIMYIMLNSP